MGVASVEVVRDQDAAGSEIGLGLGQQPVQQDPPTTVESGPMRALPTSTAASPLGTPASRTCSTTAASRLPGARVVIAIVSSPAAAAASASSTGTAFRPEVDTTSSESAGPNRAANSAPSPSLRSYVVTEKPRIGLSRSSNSGRSQAGPPAR